MIYVRTRLQTPTLFFFVVVLSFGRWQIQGAYFDFAGKWTQTHTFRGAATSDVVNDAVLRDFKNFVYRRQKEVRTGYYVQKCEERLGIHFI